MKTKNVYSSFKIIMLGILFSAVGIYVGFDTSDPILLICGCLFGIATILSIFLRFRPTFSYNDKYLIRADLTKGFKGTEKFRWEDIVGISTGDFFGLTFIRPKNGHLILMSVMNTTNYRQVLKEIVDLLQSNNPKASIDDKTIVVLSKRHKEKQVFLLIVLILLSVLMGAIMRFHRFK